MTYITQNTFTYFAVALAKVSLDKGDAFGSARNLAREYEGYYEDLDLAPVWLTASGTVIAFLRENLPGQSNARYAAECQTLMNAIERYHQDGSVRRHKLTGPHPGIANRPTANMAEKTVTDVAYYFEALRVGDIDAKAASLPTPVSKPEKRPVDWAGWRREGKLFLVYLMLPLVAGPLVSYVLIMAWNLGDYLWLTFTEGAGYANMMASRGFGNPMRANIGSILSMGTLWGTMLFIILVGSRLFRGEWPHEDR